MLKNCLALIKAISQKQVLILLFFDTVLGFGSFPLIRIQEDGLKNDIDVVLF